MNKIKVYAAIGHFRDSKNLTCVSLASTSRKSFVTNMRGNEFVPYVVLSESMVEKLSSYGDNNMEIFGQVKRLTTNYRIWNDVTDYIEQCLDIIQEKMEAEKKREGIR